MKIYTKTGDKGKTSLYGGERIAKASNLISAIGEIDELNATIGVALTRINAAYPQKIQRVKNLLDDMQTKLFNLGADLATPLDANSRLKIIRISPEDISQLEAEIDELQASLPLQTKFILPGGSEIATLIYLARAICRRAERTANKASAQTDLNPNAVIFLNRLSDWLFILFRFTNLLLKKQKKNGRVKVGQLANYQVKLSSYFHCPCQNLLRFLILQLLQSLELRVIPKRLVRLFWVD